MNQLLTFPREVRLAPEVRDADSELAIASLFDGQDLD